MTCNPTQEQKQSGDDLRIGYMLGIAVNQLRGRRTLFQAEQTNEQIADAIQGAAETLGLLHLDNLHHAPACRANRWSGQMLPTGPCTCGAARAAPALAEGDGA